MKGIRAEIRRVMAAGKKPMSSREVREMIGLDKCSIERISNAMRDMPDLVLVSKERNNHVYSYSPDMLEKPQASSVYEARRDALRNSYLAVSRFPTEFRPYVPPALRPDIQRRMDEFRAIPSLYN